VFLQLLLSFIALVFASGVIIYPKILFHRIDQKMQVKYYTDALNLALRAKKFAHLTGNHPGYIKSLLYEIQCKKNLDVNSYQIIDLLRVEKDKAKSPAREIIASMYSEKLWDYGSRTRFYYDNEDKVYLNNIEDVSTWSSSMLLTEFMRTLLDISAKETKLRKIPFLKYKKYISTDYDSEGLSIYDFLTLRSINLLVLGNRYSIFSEAGNKPVESFFIPAQEFMKAKFNRLDTFDTKTQTMRMFQTVLKIHAHDQDPTFFIVVELMRLECLRDEFDSNEISKKYVEILRSYKQKYTHKHASLKIDYSILKEYERSGSIASFSVKCREIIEKYSSASDEVESCKAMLKELSKGGASVNVNNFISKGGTQEIKVRQRNMNTIYLKVMKLPLVINRSII
jgi:hypothetical protein